MARAPGLYSKIIAWLKILLPLVALALLSTLFLISRKPDQELASPFAELARIGDAVSEQVGSPHYAGTTPDGDLLLLLAQSVRPDGASQYQAAQIEGRLVTSSAVIELNARQGVLNDGDEQARLDGGVVITSSNGYRLETQTLVSALSELAAESLGPVEGDAPAGQLSAGKMFIRAAETKGEVEILFTEGVRVVYDPSREKDALE